MAGSNNKKYWIAWIILSLMLSGFLANKTFSENTDRLALMPGPVTDGHHQIAAACDSCHSENFSNKDDLQKACVDCHGEVRKKKPIDSHPKSKFKDPRNADTLKNIDALHCTSCHVEHKPEITNAAGLTQPEDFCVYCHEDIAEDRPSHKGMEFTTCNSAGCHNFHNNQALYTDFLVKHQHEPETLEKTVLPRREFADMLDQLAEYPHDRYPIKLLTEADMDAPKAKSSTNTEQTHKDWLETAHAGSGVNCSACHTVPDTRTGDTTWTDHPGMGSCAQCHGVEVDHFQQGKHGMRLRVGLTPMTPAKARLPMTAEAYDKTLTCMSCHPAHRFDVAKAAMEGCLECHDDEHSLSYKQSLHYELWLKEQSGELPPGSGVSCASCHMPRINMDVSEWLSRVIVEHNQNATLTPNEKMIRPACLHCHGLEFSINALADNALIKNNFQGKPAFQTESMELAEKDQQRDLQRREKNHD